MAFDPDDRADYDVGYGKPPRHGQFQKGQSGNPAGRPRGRSNLTTVLNQALSAKVVVTEGGRRTTKTKLEVAVVQMVNKATTGDLRALNMVVALAQALQPQEAEPASPDLAVDRAQANLILKRLAGSLLQPRAGAAKGAPTEEADHAAK